ncbi:MAG: hypothetical protein IJH13_02795 [Bacilli bacterium]|nr:hypothetical protein [Bacilli bacterium]
MFQILADDLASYCSEAGVANIFYITKILFTILQIVVPIILIVSASFSLVSMVSSPDNPKAKKSLINKVIAAVVVVLIPFIIEIVMGAISTGGGSNFNYADCWTNAYEAYSQQQSTGDDSESGEKIREKCVINKKTKKPYDEENCCVSGGNWYKSIGKNGDPCDPKDETKATNDNAKKA